jgi:hypothetical protein
MAVGTVRAVSQTSSQTSNYNDVIVTPAMERGAMSVKDLTNAERRITEVEAAAPKDPELFGQLLDLVVDRLTKGPINPVLANEIAGQVTKGTPWAGFRSGRARLATVSANYLNWLAPPLPWARIDVVATATGRRPLGWVSAEGTVLIDLFVLNTRQGASFTRRLKVAGCTADVIRTIDITVPTRSKVLVTDARPVELVQSDWNFGGRAS